MHFKYNIQTKSIIPQLTLLVIHIIMTTVYYIVLYVIPRHLHTTETFVYRKSERA